jgi:adenylate cyclase
MHDLQMLPDHRTLSIAEGESILAASQRAGIPHTHVCGGQGKCSTCRVLVLEGSQALTPRTERENELAIRLGFESDLRLACQTFLQGNASVQRLVLSLPDQERAERTVEAAMSDELPRLGDASPIAMERENVVLFADLRSFTRFAENVPAYDVVHVLNRHFSGMATVIESHGGSINNIIGDGLLALFDSTDNLRAAEDAVACGLRMLEQVQSSFQPYLKSLYGCSLSLGVGAHVGDVVVGSVGGGARRQVTAIGDTVNFASRIESANKVHGSSFLISAELQQRVSHRFETRAREPLQITGKSGTHVLHEVLRLVAE